MRAYIPPLAKPFVSCSKNSISPPKAAGRLALRPLGRGVSPLNASRRRFCLMGPLYLRKPLYLSGPLDLSKPLYLGGPLDRRRYWL